MDEPIRSLVRDRQGNLYATGENTGRIAVIGQDGKRLADLAPTGLALLGIPPAEGMTGRNLLRTI